MKLTKLAMTLSVALAVSAAQAATSIGTFNVTVKIRPICRAVATNTGQTAVISTDTPTLAGSDINFGTQDADDGNSAINVNNVGGATTGITVRCSKRTPYTLALTPGNNASTVGLGRMDGGILDAGNTDFIPYQLYQPVITSGNPTMAASTNVWGNVGSATFPGGAGDNVLRLQGKGLAASNAVQVPVFATIPANTLDVAPDRYQDQVTVTLGW